MSRSYQTPVRFSDTDQMGHVNNSRFLTYLEDARVAFFTDQLGYQRGPQGFIVARIEIDYLQPLFHGRAPVETELWVARIGRRSFTLGYQVRQGEVEAARAESVIVGYDYPTAGTRPLGPAERAALEAALRVPPAA